MDKDSKFTRDDDGYVAVRVVTAKEALPASDPDCMFGRDENGNIAVRVVGAGGGDSSNLGYFATLEALEEAYPTAEPGNWAIVGTTDTVWVWDDDESQWVDTDQKGQVTSVNGQTGDVTVQPTLVSGTNIKTINGNSVLGSGNLELSTYLTYPAAWPTTGTTKAFCDAIAADTTAVVGKSYLGEVTLSDLPSGIVNSEIEVKIMDGTTAQNKAIVLELTSGNVSPYQWQYTYWNGGANVSGWIATGAQVNSDWNANSGVAQILNKPTIPTTAQQVGAVPQYTTMPAASASYAGTIAQYAGEPTANYEQGYFYVCNPVYVDSSATISQTTGSGLTDLAVDVATFETTEQPTQSGNTSFVYGNTPESLSPTTFTLSQATITIDPSLFLPLAKQFATDDGWDWNSLDHVIITYDEEDEDFPFNADFVDANDNVLGNAWGMNESMWGISVDGTLSSSGFQPLVMTYSQGSIAWTKNGSVVTLSDYGITYSGTPVDGDVLTVAYTAWHISGYGWQECYVQPESGGGEGIEWVVQLDFDHTQSYAYFAQPVWRIVGGLPDGTYEYYFQTIINDSYNKVVYKVRLKIYTDNGTRRCWGYLGYVYNGDFVTYSSEYKPHDDSWTDYVFIDGNDLILYNGNPPFRSSIYSGWPEDIAGIFKITAIKNVDTGEEYIPEGHIKTSDESYNDYMNGSIQLYSLVNIPQTPLYERDPQYWYGGNSPFYIRFNNGYSDVVGRSGGYRPIAEADISIETSLGGKFHAIIENSYHGYRARLLEQSGDLMNARLLTNSVGVLGFEAGFATTTERYVYTSYGVKGSRYEADLVTASDINEMDTEVAFDTVGANITPQNLGVIAQFNNEIESAPYTEGHFYKATGTPVVVPENATIVVTNYNDITMTVNAADLVDAINARVGWNKDYIRECLIGNKSWEFGYDADNNAITSAYWSQYGVFDNQDVLSCFTVSTTGSYSGRLYLYADMNYRRQHTEIQNQVWKQVNVQAAPTAPATMPTLTVANWSSNTQTVTVNGVTASNSVLVAPAPASATDWSSAGIICTAQASNSLTFTCATTPTNDITVNVCILN